MLHSLIIDDFLDDLPIVRGWADTATFENSTNPYDSLEYHGIATQCPQASLTRALQRWFPGAKLVHSMVRLSTLGAPIPYQAHADAFMGSRYSVIVYLNRPEHCRGGTSLLKHKNGAVKESDPGDWKADENNPAAWEILLTCPMVQNRAFIYRSDLLHRSDPLGGFGEFKHDGRLVLIGLFDL
jgi:hypothetical protein